MPELIESSQNPRLKELRKLHDRKQREHTGLFLAEGEDLLAEALRRGARPRTVFYDAGEEATLEALLADLPPAVERVAVRGRALKAVGSLGSGSRVIGLWEQRWSDLDGVAEAGVGVYLHEVADPGNVGAVVRAALAFVPSFVVLSPGAADPFGPKAVRASMGAIFGQRVVRETFERARLRLGARWRTVALSPRRGSPLRELSQGGPTLYCLGSERRGLPEGIVRTCDRVAHVPLRAEGAESLNVAMTATLCLYESAVARPDTPGRPLPHILSNPDG